MKILESLGYTPESGNQPVVIGYFFEGESGLFAFSETREVSDDLEFNINLDSSSDYVREVTK